MVEGCVMEYQYFTSLGGKYRATRYSVQDHGNSLDSSSSTVMLLAGDVMIFSTLQFLECHLRP